MTHRFSAHLLEFLVFHYALLAKACTAPYTNVWEAQLNDGKTLHQSLAAYEATQQKLLAFSNSACSADHRGHPALEVGCDNWRHC